MDKILEEFDNTFGVSLYSDENSNGYDCSDGRMAGCDDCYTNLKLRDEHKEYLIDTLKSYRLSILKEIQDKLPERLSIEDNDLAGVSNIGYNACLEEIKSIINSLK
jgi:hypothetical protein